MSPGDQLRALLMPPEFELELAHAELVAAATWEQRRHAWDRMRQILRSRPADRVEQLERERLTRVGLLQ